MNGLRTPEQWQARLKVHILDPDGWREPGAPEWLTPITQAEFLDRAGRSTTNWRHYVDGGDA
jgi:phage terminase small subunit